MSKCRWLDGEVCSLHSNDEYTEYCGEVPCDDMDDDEQRNENGLKPCPCCGGAAHMITRPQIGIISGDDGFLSTIKCLGGGDCGLEVSAWALKKAWAIESVTKKWNRRANDDNA